MAGTRLAALATAQSEEEVAVDQAYLILARRLRQIEHQTWGLWPVTPDLAFADVTRSLGQALAALGDSVGLVAPRTRWGENESRAGLSAAAVREGLDLLTPLWSPRPGFGRDLEQIVSLVHERYTRILLDLTGMEAALAHEVALVPGVVMVIFAASGRIGEFALARIGRRLPPDRLAGVVLVDVVSRKAIASGRA